MCALRRKLIIELDGPPFGRSIWNRKNTMKKERSIWNRGGIESTVLEQRCHEGYGERSESHLECTE